MLTFSIDLFTPVKVLYIKKILKKKWACFKACDKFHSIEVGDSPHCMVVCLCVVQVRQRDTDQTALQLERQRRLELERQLEEEMSRREEIVEQEVKLRQKQAAQVRKLPGTQAF